MTFFPNDRAFTKRETEMTLVHLAAKIEDTTRESKRELPGVKLQRYGDRRTDRRCLRNTENVITSHGLEIDHDPKDGPTTIDAAAAALRRAGIAALLHTSASGKADAWHALVPLSAEHTADERTVEVEKINALFGGEIDQHASFTVAQHAYYGAVRGGAPVDVRLVDGQPIDTIDLPRLPKGRRTVEGGDERTRDESGSGVLFRLACRYRARDDDYIGFVIAAWEDEACLSHLEKEERAGRDRSTRAVERAWENSAKVVSETRNADDFANLEDLEARAKDTRLTILSPAECSVAPQRGYILKGMIAPGDVGVIFGQPGAGKSLIAPYLGYRVAMGEDAFGMRTHSGSVLYVAAEDEAGMRGRVSALRGELGDAPGFGLVGGVSNLFMGSPDFRALMDVVKARKPALIIVDTLAMAFPGLEENSAESMGKVIAAARALAKHGAAVVLVHHSPKAADGTPRGHSILNGALDFALEVQPKDGSGIVRGRLTKNRNGSCDRDIAFRIAVSTMGKDEDGDPITYARCEPMADAPTAGPRATPAEKAALAVLDRVRWQSSDGAVRLEDWRAALLDDPGVSAAEKLDDRKRRARDVISSLSRKRLIVVREGRVFDPNADPGDFDALDGSDMI